MGERAQGWVDQAQEEVQYQNKNKPSAEEISEMEPAKRNDLEQKEPEPTPAEVGDPEGSGTSRAKRVRKRPSWLKEFIMAESH